MVKVIGVRFRNAGKLYYFDPCGLWPTSGDQVIVETARGIEMGEAVGGVCEVEEDKITPPLRPVVRIASIEDVRHNQENIAREPEALAICREKVEAHKLPMKCIGCEYTFDNSKLLFYFTSDKRVDFRLLVKDLAAKFHTRIELRQVGVRDEAKMMGGLGICGRPVCCSRFLGDFEPVSIKMAKEQGLSLNPTKISGMCGRLMCCLKFEEDHYEATRKRLPRIGREVITPDGAGTVVDVNVLLETVRVRVAKGDSFEQKDYPAVDVQKTGRSAQNMPEETEAPDDEVDPEIMKALKASEMDVPDAEADVTFAREDLEEDALNEKKESPKEPAAGHKKHDRHAPANGDTKKKDKPPRRVTKPDTHKEKPAEKPEKAPKKPPENDRQKEEQKPVAPPKRDPWVVPEEYRQH